MRETACASRKSARQSIQRCVEVLGAPRRHSPVRVWGARVRAVPDAAREPPGPRPQGLAVRQGSWPRQHPSSSGPTNVTSTPRAARISACSQSLPSPLALRCGCWIVGGVHSKWGQYRTVLVGVAGDSGAELCAGSSLPPPDGNADRGCCTGPELCTGCGLSHHSCTFL
eukprot:1192548-Rhodomonas_salina.1